MHSKPIRWGIVGLGQIASVFAGALAGTNSSVLAAVCSRQRDKAHRFASACGGDVAAFSDYGEMLKNASIDVIYIATPNTMHHEHALMAIAAGKPVLCEKPMASSAAEAREIAEAARLAGVFFMEAMWTRFLPAIVEAKRLVVAGAIGMPQSFYGELSFHQPFAEHSRFYNPALGGGALLDLGVYPASLAVHFLGLPKSCHATGVLAKTGVEQRASIVLGFGDATATINCGFDLEGANEAVIAGQKGFIRLHRPMNQPSAFTLVRSPEVSINSAEEVLPQKAARGQMASLKAALRPFSPRRKKIVVKPYIGNGFFHQISEVERCLLAGLTESAIMPLDHSIAVLEIIDTAREAIRA